LTVRVVGVSAEAETPGPTLTATGRAAKGPESLTGGIPPGRLPIEEVIGTV